MTAPRDPYEWHDVGGMVDRDTVERLKAIYPPMTLAAGLASVGCLDRETMLELVRPRLSRRQRVLDQAVRPIYLANKDSHDVAQCKFCLSDIRAEFARLSKEQA